MILVTLGSRSARAIATSASSEDGELIDAQVTSLSSPVTANVALVEYLGREVSVYRIESSSSRVLERALARVRVVGRALWGFMLRGNGFLSMCSVYCSGNWL